jgi:hypothetical protein
MAKVNSIEKTSQIMNPIKLIDIITPAII